MNSMTDPIVIKRIPVAAGGASTRIGLSAQLGADVDLVLGYEYEIPDELSDKQRREALLFVFTEEYTRRAALGDMLASGFLDASHVIAHLAVMDSVLDDLEDEGDLVLLDEFAAVA
ncbi:hypothetical protein [Streptomyces sp. NPDC013489]|uniref:hypothetical protein n=1 Tax=Streptomyces sp. NPDC013489 TaxID=3155606 RepID=UPI0033D9C2CE